MPPKKSCCICLGKSSSRFHPTKNYRDYFSCCFGPSTEWRSGYLCNTCKYAVNEHCKVRTREFYHLVDSKGKIGVAGHRKIGGRRLPLASCNLNVSLDDCDTSFFDFEISVQEIEVSTVENEQSFFGGIVNDSVTSQSESTVFSSSPKLAKRPQPELLDLSGHDYHCKPLKKFKAKHDDSRQIDFLGFALPNVVVDKILSYLHVPDISSVMQVQQTFLFSQLALERNANSELRNLIDVSDDKPLSDKQRNLLRALISNKQHLSNDKDIFEIGNSSGRSMKIAVIPHTEKSSATASNSTLKRRARLLEKIEQALSSTPTASPTNQKADVHSQRVVVKRNRDDYVKVAKDAGIKVITFFDRATVLALRSIMPFNLWRLLKRTFKLETGVNVLGTKQQLEDELEELSFEYECGNFVGEDGKEISFVRVKDLKQVITQVVHDLRQSQNLCYLDNLAEETLWLHLSGDKGGKSTKLLVQVINTQGRHSIKKAKLIATFEGGKDSRYNIERAFGPVIATFQEIAANISQLKLQLPPHSSQPTVVLPNVLCDPEKDAIPPSTQSKRTFKPLEDLNISNVTVSPSCKICKSCLHSVKQNPSPSAQNPETSAASSLPNPDTSRIYQTCKVTGGGDWEWIARCAGLTGPNGKYFCFHCKAMLDDTKKGKPHSLHILPNYRDKTNGHSRILPPDEDFLRSIPGITEKTAEFVAAGSRRDKAMQFENCIYEPLLTGVGTGGIMIDTYSCTPLHISLGLGLQILNIIEHDAVDLDKQIWNSRGGWEPYTPIMKEQDRLLRRCATLELTIQDRNESIDERKEQQVLMKHDKPQAFRKNGRGVYTDKSVGSRKVRNDYEVLAGEKESFEKDKKWLEKLLKGKQGELETTLKALESVKGPFKTRFDDVLSSMKLQRAAYHSGSIVGPDVYKLTRSKNIKLLGNVFRPVKLKTSDGQVEVFSSGNIVHKMKMLLSKFAQCYTLYTDNRVLCRHEVEQLVLRCCSYGCWFPVHFPNQSLSRKFHLMTVEVPRQVRRMLSVGMLTEQTIESIHPYVNKLDRMFASVSEKGKKGILVMRQQNIFSNTVLPWLK